MKVVEMPFGIRGASLGLQERITFDNRRKSPCRSMPIVPANQPVVGTVNRDFTGGRVLIVDCAVEEAALLEEILREQGYETASADSRQEARVRSREFQPDLVVMAVDQSAVGERPAAEPWPEAGGREGVGIVFVVDPPPAAAPAGADFVRRPLRADEVAARARFQLERRRLAARVRALSGQLEEARTERNLVLGMAAHDLRNPLGTIRGLAEFLRDGVVGPLSADQLKLVDAIHDASRSMHAFVNDLLDVTALDMGAMRLSRERHDLGEVLRPAVQVAAIDAARKKSRVVLAARSTAPGLLVDAPKLRQVADNLLTNAVKYSPPGSTITMGIFVDARECGFGVRDQGPGIPEEERDRLFQDFGRLSVRPTGGEKSTGLGLAICRKIVEAHGGAITAENLADGGCEFRVTLPLAP